MATGSVEDRVLFKKFDFHYAVFDEGHMLKNMSSMRFQNLMKISVSMPKHVRFADLNLSR